MQECPYCGQLNSDFEDRCVYCGELLYIQVEHDDEETSNDINEINHQYADKIAQELLKDENNKQTKTFDDLDEFTRELLSPTDISDESVSISDNDDSYYFEEDNNDTITNESFNDTNMFEETLADITTDFTEDNENTYFEYETEDVPEVHEKTREKLIEIESKLKKKIKRNKKLETRLGLSFKNIALVINNINGPIEVLGSVSTNTVYNNHCLKLSVICYDNDFKEIERNSTLIIMNSLKRYYDFNLILKPDISKTSILILLPEIVDKLPDAINEVDKKNTQNISKNKNISRNLQKPKNKQVKKNTQAKKIDSRKSVAVETSNSIFIEQMKNIEHRIGMNITNTSVLIKSNSYLEVVGEIYIKSPDKYNDIKIAATCYDKNNKIIATESTHINTKLYLGFDTLCLKLKDVDVCRVERIRLYPTFQ